MGAALVADRPAPAPPGAGGSPTSPASGGEVGGSLKKVVAPKSILKGRKGGHKKALSWADDRGGDLDETIEYEALPWSIYDDDTDGDCCGGSRGLMGLCVSISVVVLLRKTALEYGLDYM